MLDQLPTGLEHGLGNDGWHHTPVPEPSTYGIVLLLVCLLLVWWKRRKS
jgi:hypothetical protein